jgi:WD40 repeat protein
MHFAKFDPHILWLFVRDLRSNQPPVLVATNLHVNYVQGHCFLPKSGAVAYVTQRRTVAVIDPADGRLLRELPAPKSTDSSPLFIANISVSPDESKFAIASLSGTGVDVIDALTGKLLYPLPDETSAIWWLAWSPDSRRLAVTRANGEIGIWNLEEVEAQLSQIDGNR